MPKRVRCLLMRPPQGYGGPDTFQRCLERHLVNMGFTCGYFNDRKFRSKRPDVIFVIASTRRLLFLALARLRGVKVVLRLDGVITEHRREYRGLIHYLYCESDIALSMLIRWILASHVVYQSQFVKECWERRWPQTSVPSSIIYNGARSTSSNFSGHLRNGRLIAVEGSVEGHFAKYILAKFQDFDIDVYGKVDAKFKQHILALNPRVQFFGVIEQNEILEKLPNTSATADSY